MAEGLKPGIDLGGALQMLEPSELFRNALHCDCCHRPVPDDATIGLDQTDRLRRRTTPSPISPPVSKASVAGSGTGKESVPYASCCSPFALMSASAPHCVPP